jgi:hypothetical protein
MLLLQVTNDMKLHSNCCFALLAVLLAMLWAPRTPAETAQVQVVFLSGLALWNSIGWVWDRADYPKSLCGEIASLKFVPCGPD